MKYDENNSGWLTEENLARAFESTGNLNHDEAELLAMVTVEQGGQIQEKTQKEESLSAPAPAALTLRPSKSISSMHSSASSLESPQSTSTVSVIGRSAAERLLGNMMMQAKSMDKKTVKERVCSHRNTSRKSRRQKESDEVIRCNVDAKYRPFVLACVSKLRDTDKKAWYVSQIETLIQGCGILMVSSIKSPCIVVLERKCVEKNLL